MLVSVEEALRFRRISPRYRPYARRLLETVAAHLEAIDRLVVAHTENWRLDRLTAIDRNILRLGIAELRWIEDVPPKTAIHEAIKLAARYGSEDSSGFVNGVLDAVYKGGMAPE